MTDYIRDIPDFKGKKVLVMGLGLFSGGLAVTRFLVARGANVTVTDVKSAEQLHRPLAELAGLPVTFRLGLHDAADFASAELVVVSPAVPQGSEYLDIARRHNVPLETEMNLFFKLCGAPIVGVTGSNGKSTTAALTAALLDTTRTVHLGGNIGRSLLPEVDGLQHDDVVVLELSSFQLEDMASIGASPHVAVVTNLSPNHLDRHGTVEAYYAAKKNILRFQKAGDYAVLNADDAELRRWSETVAGKRLWFSTEGPVEEGAWLAGGVLTARVGSKVVKVCDASEIPLPGEHNVANVLCAVAAAGIFEIDGERMRKAIRAFTALEHRLELVRSVKGIRFYNDSIATTPESAIKGVGSMEKPTVLIAGGYDKGIALDDFAAEIARDVSVTVLMGATADKLQELILRSSSGADIRRAASLQEAVRVAAEAAGESGAATVLLCPGCASYDMFENFADRGAQFKGAVNAL